MFWTISGLSVGCVSMISQMPTGWQEFLAQRIQTALVGGNEQATAWDIQGYTAAKFHRRDTPHHDMLPYCCHMLPIARQHSQSQAWMAWDSQQGCCWIYIPKSLSICQLQMGRAPSMHVLGLASRCRWCWSSPVGAVPTVPSSCLCCRTRTLHFTIFRCQKRTCSTGKSFSQPVKWMSLRLFVALCLGWGLFVFRNVSWPLLVAAWVE